MSCYHCDYLKKYLPEHDGATGGFACELNHDPDCGDCRLGCGSFTYNPDKFKECFGKEEE